MIKNKAIINNKLGLHARPSALLVSATSKFKSEVFFTKNGLRINGKSIMGVMMLAAEKGSEIIVEISGPDEEEAMEKILKVIQSKFGEND